MLKKITVILGLMAIVIGFVSVPVMAQTKPIQLSLFSPVQIFPEDTAISGIRLSLLYGKNTSVTGLDWGLVNHTTSGQSLGVQFGLVGLSDADFKGLQNNFVNITKGNFEGIQWGFVNNANFAKGLQFGFINYANSMEGIQIGLLNFIKTGGLFPVFPIVNWSF